MKITVELVNINNNKVLESLDFNISKEILNTPLFDYFSKLTVIKNQMNQNNLQYNSQTYMNDDYYMVKITSKELNENKLNIISQILLEEFELRRLVQFS